jgi:hypothetical protein
MPKEPIQITEIPSKRATSTATGDLVKGLKESKLPVFINLQNANKSAVAP